MIDVSFGSFVELHEIENAAGLFFISSKTTRWQIPPLQPMNGEKENHP